MDCTRFEQLIQRYLDGDLGPVHASQVEEHASTCTACAALHRQFETVFISLRTHPRDPAPPGLEAAILARVDFDAFRPSLRERILRWLVRPEEALPGPAQTALAVLFLVAVLQSSTGRLGAGLQRYLEMLGEAATWTYAWSSAVAAEASSRFLVERWPLFRQTAETLFHACRLLLERSAAVWIAAGILLVLVLAAGMLRRARLQRGGSRARLQTG